MKYQVVGFAIVMLYAQTAFACINATLSYYSPWAKLVLSIGVLLPLTLIVSSLAPRFQHWIVRAATVIMTFVGFGVLWSFYPTHSEHYQWDQLPVVALSGTVVSLALLGLSEAWKRATRFRKPVFAIICAVSWTGAFFVSMTAGNRVVIDDFSPEDPVLEKERQYQAGPTGEKLIYKKREKLEELDLTF